MDPPTESPGTYEGYDPSPTTQRELWGWYSYGLAAEVFAICGPGSFLPVTLEQLAREVGVLRNDPSRTCLDKTDADGACVVVMPGGYQVNTSSFALYSFSLAILVQTVVLVSISSVADYGGYRKRLLLMFAYIGAGASMGFILVSPAIYLAGVVLTVISIASLGSGFVLLNSFLPLLVASHPDVSAKPEYVQLNNIAGDDDEDQDVADGLLNGSHIPRLDLQEERASRAQKLSNLISSKGVGVGYAAAVFVQLIGIVILLAFNKFTSSETAKSTLPMRSVLFVVGLWWATFTIPTSLWLRRRPGPPLPLHAFGSSSGGCFAYVHYILFAWKSLWQTVKTAAQLRQVIIFLIGWFLLSDAIATISGTAILFARTELKMGTAAVAMLSITATASGIFGAFLWPKIAQRYNLSSITVLIRCVMIYECIPLYCLLGFLPPVKALGWLGLQQAWEIFPLAFVLGFVMGGISSYARSIFGTLIPPGLEAAFYALYAVTDKGSSIIGPAIVGRIIDVTGSVRMGFWFLAVVCILPVPAFWWVDLDKGREDALAMAKLKSRGKGMREH